MATESTGRAVSKGMCTFCKVEIAKNKMTQHLKFCKQRIAAIASQEEKSQETKTRLFHILAEGEYSPQYWIHFEVPASASLWSLDGFIKEMWIDDLDHLSGFEINGTNYRDDYSDGFYPFSVEKEIEKEEAVEEELSEEEKEKEIREIIEEVLSTHMERASLYGEVPFLTDPLPAEWIVEIKKLRSEDELINFLKEELTRVKKEERQIWKPDWEYYNVVICFLRF
jgi:hypothetical protein